MHGIEKLNKLEIISSKDFEEINKNFIKVELVDNIADSIEKEDLKSSKNTLLVSIEAGITDGWQKFTGRYGLYIGINTFGESAPG